MLMLRVSPWGRERGKSRLGSCQVGFLQIFFGGDVFIERKDQYNEEG